MPTAREILKKYFGYDDFRPGQEALIRGILSGQDVLGIMPTGAGKSVCYQVPALMMRGVTVVISPLISLMMDQVKALNQAGVHAAYINSSLTEGQIAKALENAANSVYKIVYVAPERLETWGFRNFVSRAEISMVTVDEAHCVSQWGQDFRPSYLKIAEFVASLPVRPVVSAFTATATDAVKRDMLSLLQLQRPLTLITGFDRENLYFSVKQYQPKQKELFILKYIEKHPGQSGIIYCATRKNVEKITLMLKSKGVRAAAYHGGMENGERTKSQNAFIYDEISVVVATNAFGMGIDKSNVRFVIHYNMPQSIENYYQEAGRAGRDGEDADCILLYTPQDIVINRFLIESKENDSTRGMDEYRLQQMIGYCTMQGCYRNYILRYFGEDTEEDCGYCSYCLHEETEKLAPESRSPGYGAGKKYGSYGKKGAGGKRKGRSSAADLSEREEALFERLRELRREIAQREGVPPYLVFSDRALVSMCLMAKELDHPEDLLKVPGVGEYKLDKYGIDFYDEIMALR